MDELFSFKDEGRVSSDFPEKGLPSLVAACGIFTKALGIPKESSRNQRTPMENITWTGLLLPGYSPPGKATPTQRVTQENLGHLP